MSLSSFSQKKTPPALIEKLCKAWEEAYRYATAVAAAGDINLLSENIITQKQIGTELKSIAEELAKLDY